MKLHFSAVYENNVVLEHLNLSIEEEAILLDEINCAATDIDSQGEELDTLSGVMNTTDQLNMVVGNIPEIDPIHAELVSIVGDMVVAGTDIESNIFTDFDATDTLGTTIPTSEGILENTGQVLKKIWEAIKKFLIRLKDSIVAFFLNIFNFTKAMVGRFFKMKEIIEDLKKKHIELDTEKVKAFESKTKYAKITHMMKHGQFITFLANNAREFEDIPHAVKNCGKAFLNLIDGNHPDNYYKDNNQDDFYSKDNINNRKSKDTETTYKIFNNEVIPALGEYFKAIGVIGSGTGIDKEKHSIGNTSFKNPDGSTGGGALTDSGGRIYDTKIDVLGSSLKLTIKNKLSDILKDPIVLNNGVKDVTMYSNSYKSPVMGANRLLEMAIRQLSDFSFSVTPDPDKLIGVAKNIPPLTLQEMDDWVDHALASIKRMHDFKTKVFDNLMKDFVPEQHLTALANRYQRADSENSNKEKNIRSNPHSGYHAYATLTTTYAKIVREPLMLIMKSKMKALNELYGYLKANVHLYEDSVVLTETEKKAKEDDHGNRTTPILGYGISGNQRHYA